MESTNFHGCRVGHERHSIHRQHLEHDQSPSRRVEVANILRRCHGTPAVRERQFTRRVLHPAHWFLRRAAYASTDNPRIRRSDDFDEYLETRSEYAAIAFNLPSLRRDSSRGYKPHIKRFVWRSLEVIFPVPRLSPSLSRRRFSATRRAVVSSKSWIA